MRPRSLAAALAVVFVAITALSVAAGLSSALGPAAAAAAAAQPAAAPTTGPIIADFGPAYAVPDPGLATPMLQEFKVRFDVNTTPDDPKVLNRSLETAARFLNMHGKAGMSASRLKVAIVVHGAAGKDVLSNEAYRKRHGVDNPNVPLLAALKGAGVRVYLCGQTAGSRGISAGELTPPAQMALSAMTAHLVLQSEGYVLNPF